MTSGADDLPSRLAAEIAKMLDADETISTRNILKRMPDDFAYPTSVSRPKELRPIYKKAVKDQALLRAAAKGLARTSGSEAEAKIARRDLRIEEFEDQVQLLTASHRALYAAVGEMGGAAAWLQFFENHQRALNMLDQLGARTPHLPTLRLVRGPDPIPSPLPDDEVPYR